MAGPAADPLAEDRIESGADRERQVLVVAGERQRKRDERVDRPRVQAPVIDRRRHRHVARRPHRIGRQLAVDDRRGEAERRIVEVIHRLQHAEEHQADAHAGGEQHREPAGIGIVRHRILSAEPDPAVGRYGDDQTEQHEQVGRGHEQPIECRGQPDAQAAKHVGGAVAEDQRHDDECYDGDRRHEEHRVVYVETENLDIVLARFDSVVVRLDRGIRHRGPPFFAAAGFDQGTATLLRFPQK